MNNIRVGVIGVGYLGTFHAEKYAAFPGVEFVGVVDADPGRAALIAQKLNTRAFSDVSALFDRVDAVNVVVPTAFHHRTAKSFLENGIHVFLEKPMTVTIAEADELIDLAHRRGVVLQVGHIERFNPAVTAIKGLLRSPRYMTAERTAPFTVRCTDVNVILDLMIHDLDIVCDLAGSEPREMSAAGASVITSEIDVATARIVFHNGCAADITASRISDEKKRLLRVFDDAAVYTADYQQQKAMVSRRGDNSIPELVTSTIATERRDTLREEIEAFVRSIRTGGRPLVSGVEGRRALALAQMISDNINKGIKQFVSIS